MSSLKHLLMTDDTGKAILAAIQSSDIVQARVADISASAEEIVQNASLAIERKKAEVFNSVLADDEKTLCIAGDKLLSDDNGRFDIPYASNLHAGVVKVLDSKGIKIDQEGNLCLVEPDNAEIFARSSPNRALTLSKLEYAIKLVLSDNTKAWSDADKSAIRQKIGLDDYVLPLKVNKDGRMTVAEAYALEDGLYYFIKPLYNASTDGHSIHGMCSISEHFINNYDYGIYFGDYSSSSQKFTTVGSIDGYGQIERG